MKSKIKNLFRDELILHTAIVFVGTSVVGVFNLLYHLISVRLLSPQDYGTFNALISFVMFTSMAISPLGTTLTRFFSEYIAKGQFNILLGLVKKLAKRLGITGLLIILFFIFASPYLASFLKTEVFYLYICGGIILLSLFSPIVISLFQSFQKFVTYSLIGIVTSFCKLLIGGVLMVLGYKITGGLLGYLSGPIVIVSVALLFVPKLIKQEIKATDSQGKTKINLLPIYKYFFPVSIAMLSFTFITNIDVVLVKHFFSELEAGYYSIAQMIGKIALFLPSALAIVILPKSTRAHVTNGTSLRFLKKSIVLGSLCCVIFTLIAFLLPGFLLKVLTGKVNPTSTSLAGLFALAMSFYAITWIIINYFLATHNLRFVAPFALITLCEAATIYLWHPSLAVILYILLIFGIISLTSSLFIVKISKNKKAV